jgi:hypothetical protein
MIIEIDEKGKTNYPLKKLVNDLSDISSYHNCLFFKMKVFCAGFTYDYKTYLFSYDGSQAKIEYELSSTIDEKRDIEIKELISPILQGTFTLWKAYAHNQFQNFYYKINNSGNPEEILKLRDSDIIYVNTENNTAISRRAIYRLGLPPYWDFTLVDLANDEEIKITFKNQESCLGGLFDNGTARMSLVKIFNSGKSMIFSYQNPVDRYVLYDSTTYSMKCLLDDKFGKTSIKHIDQFDSFDMVESSLWN